MKRSQKDRQQKTAAAAGKKAVSAWSKDRDEGLTLRRTLPKGKTEQESLANLVVYGVLGHTLTVRHWSADAVVPEDQIDLTALHGSMEQMAAAVQAGDLSGGEALLMSQAASLNALFVNLARRARGCQLVPQFEMNLRWALRAQNQCRATLETLAVMKNPPVFARQANIAQGPQQVNNGPVVNGEVSRVRAALPDSQPIKLLEGQVARVDGCQAAKTGADDPSVEAVGEVHRAAHVGGKGSRVAERVPRRPAAKTARGRQ